MTYLQIVNNILKRLRERTVSSVSETTYSNLIGVLVNDALVDVENSWSWSGLRTTLVASTSNNVFNYELNGSQNNMTVLDVINDTDDIFLKQKGSHEFNNLFLNSVPATGSPYYYSFNGISADGDTQVDLYPIPDGVYTINFNVILRSAELTDNATTFSIPTKPIELLAYALAVEERGEDGGISPTSAYARANNALQDAISLDATKHTEETIWYES
jgi:hypothetical protein|tara:strand:- start:1813 stop:2460 length:648 start_codon:yes stop_codon:yes gene_type:complete